MSQPKSKRTLSPAVALIVTALLMVTVVGQARFYESVKWDAPQIVAAAFRGDDGNAKPPVYSDAALKGLYGTLITAVSGGYDKVRPTSKKLVLFGKKFEYTMSSKLTELFDGSLTVEIGATPAGGKAPIMTWTHTVEKGGDANKALDAFGSSVGAELAGMKK